MPFGASNIASLSKHLPDPGTAGLETLDDPRVKRKFSMKTTWNPQGARAKQAILMSSCEIKSPDKCKYQ